VDGVTAFTDQIHALGPAPRYSDVAPELLAKVAAVIGQGGNRVAA